MKTPNLQLPEVPKAIFSASDEINAGFRMLDAIVHLAVIDKDLNSPPNDAEQGDRYIVPVGAIGDWTGWDRSVAVRLASSWRRIVPRPGWRARVLDESAWYLYTGTEWTAEIIEGGGGSGPSPSRIDYFHECLSYPSTSSTTNDWFATASSGAVTQSGEYLHPGIWRISTGIVASNGNASIIMGPNTTGGGIVLGAVPISAEYLVRFSALPTSTQNFLIVLGFMDQVGTAVNRAAAVLLWDGSAARWAASARQASTTSTVNGTSSVSTGQWYHVKIEATDTAVNVYIDGELEATVATNIPTAAMTIGAVAAKQSGTGTAGIVDIDFIRLSQDLPAPRY